MLQYDRVGLDWSTFFSLEKEEKERFLQDIKLTPSSQYTWETRNYLFPSTFPQWDDCLENACKIELLSFCIEEYSFAADVLTESDYEKSKDLFHRKQYDCKLLKSLLEKLLRLLSQNEDRAQRLFDYLKRDILKRAKDLREQKAQKLYFPLKEQIKTIASGVKADCYFSAEKSQQKNENTVYKELNEYILEKFGYDYNEKNGKGYIQSAVFGGNMAKRVNVILQNALYQDESFWSNHKDFDIMAFVEAVRKHNSLRHAEKILDHIFTEISKSQVGKQILEKSLSLIFLYKEDFLNGLETRAFRFTFERFPHMNDFQESEKKNLCYPLTCAEGVQEKLSQGKEIIESFLREMYADEYRRVYEIMSEQISRPSVVFSGRKQELRKIETSLQAEKLFDEWTLRDILDYPMFGYFDDLVDRSAVSAYCSEYFSSENIWNRLYLKAYDMNEWVKDKKVCFANLFEVYYDLFQFIEKMTGLKTSYQRDTKGRDRSYSQLKSILQKYGVKISDEYKSDYIISLLDRKVAIREESERFPVLEQLGDAIYGFALAELLFYNPDEENIEKAHNDYVSAKFQIEAADKAGIAQLYLSAYSLPRKYERDILIDADDEAFVLKQETEQRNQNKKYIADSLEMIVGTICCDCGYQTAIEFTKKLLKETFSDRFKEELHWGDSHPSNIERDYWTKILPAPYSIDHDHIKEQSVLWHAFDKFFKAYVLGTEEVETRRHITNSHGDNGLYDDYNLAWGEINKVFYEYLHNGLKSAIEKFGNSVKEKYKNI